MKVRVALTALAGVICAYFAVRAFVTPVPYADPALTWCAAAIFTLCAGTALLVPGAPGDREHVGAGALPAWASILAAVCATGLPLLANAALGPDSDPMAPYATWYVGAGGMLATIACARRRPVSAWIGIAGLALTTSIELRSLGAALSVGLVGSALWVVIAQMLVSFIDRAYRDTVRLAVIQHQSSAWRATQDTRRRERRERVQYAIAVAGPVLSRVIAAQGRLEPDERERALRAEAALRDELRGAVFLDDAVRRTIAHARESGRIVSLYDEGELDEAAPEQIARVRAEVARIIAGADAERIIVRTSSLPGVAATVVGRGSGEDDVDLWEEIPR